jgi:hypothetical protein
MANIDRRVRLLTEVLQEEGFGWIAVEIVEAVEFGRRDLSELDNSVASQRHELGQRLHAGASSTSKPSDIRSSATRIVPLKQDFSAEEQITVAVHILMDRLAISAQMLAESADALSQIMETPVTLSVEDLSEARPVVVSSVRTAASELKAITPQLINWLNSESSET